MLDLQEVKAFLKNYDGPPVRLMEVCGTHTVAIAHGGIRSLLSPRIQLVSGPGCPVCVTSAAYIDRLVAIGKDEDCTVMAFGDMLRVTGTRGSLLDAKGSGVRVQMVYTPMDALRAAQDHPDQQYVFAAVGFETTAPLYALLVRQSQSQGVHNLRLLTALKVMPPVLDWICSHDPDIDGFLCPGHVSVITGSAVFVPLAEKYGLPFVVAGFSPDQILGAVYALIQNRGEGGMHNLYTSVVTPEGNLKAQAAVQSCYQPGEASWRGFGILPGSGLYLRPEYSAYDAGSQCLFDDGGTDSACRCGDVLMGRMGPEDCSLFGKACTPQHPLGACMVSGEGTCGIWHSMKG